MALSPENEELVGRDFNCEGLRYLVGGAYGPMIERLLNAARQDERSKLSARWEPIETAPKDGQHFLACQAGTSFGWWDGKAAPAVQTVVHWWGNPTEEGFYTSVNEAEPQRPFLATHWKPLDGPEAGQ